MTSCISHSSSAVPVNLSEKTSEAYHDASSYLVGDFNSEKLQQSLKQSQMLGKLLSPVYITGEYFNVTSSSDKGLFVEAINSKTKPILKDLIKSCAVAEITIEEGQIKAITIPERFQAAIRAHNISRIVLQTDGAKSLLGNNIQIKPFENKQKYLDFCLAVYKELMICS
jgi:hypothetical protein